MIADAASGTSIDHAYGNHSIPLGFTFEMRGNGDYGRFGFVLPPQLIIENAEEVVASFVGFVTKAREFGFFSLPPVPADN